MVSSFNPDCSENPFLFCHAGIVGAQNKKDCSAKQELQLLKQTTDLFLIKCKDKIIWVTLYFRIFTKKLSLWEVRIN